MAHDDALFEALRMQHPTEPNPCVLLYGPGPEGKTCKTCEQLICREWGRRYYKCLLRRVSNCEATDHRVRWRACGKYQEGAE